MATPVAAGALRRTLLAGAAFAALGTGALATQDAQAAFTLRRCEGAAGVGGRGASFQATLHTRFKTFYERSIGCPGATGPVYTSTGSGDGKAALGAGGRLRDGSEPGRGVRLATVSFGAADEAPTPTELATMNAGPTAATGDDGRLRTIPVATGASVFILHAPEGCDLSDVANRTDGATGSIGDTGDRASSFTQRIRLTGERVEAVFGGDADAATWGQIAPGIRGDPTGISGGDQTHAAEGNCANVPVRRIVRSDRSGTTYGWKTYLHTVNNRRGWTSTWATDNREWPAAGGSGRATILAAATGAACNNADKICSAEGGSSVANAVAATDGSIGYVDLATARRAFSTTVGTSDTSRDYTFWAPLEVIDGPDRGKYAEPTFHPAAHFNDSVDRGASCDTAAVVDAPTTGPGGDLTFGDWSKAYAAGGNAYPACVLTYVMAWDDNAAVYGASAAEEGKARTVKDYLELIVSNGGQNLLLGADYSPLPASIVTAAQNGVAAIDWNKTSGGGEQRPPVVVPPVVVPPVVVPPTVNPPAAPSNVFSVPSSKTTSSLITFSVQLPGAGALKAEATTRVGRRTIKVATVSASPRGAGRVTLRLTLSSAAKKALARAKGKKLKVAVKFTFTPAGGTASTVTRTVTVKAAARRAARRKAAKR